jgi:hypothetical protein
VIDTSNLPSAGYRASGLRAETGVSASLPIYGSRLKEKIGQLGLSRGNTTDHIEPLIGRGMEGMWPISLTSFSTRFKRNYFLISEEIPWFNTK